MRSPKTDDRTWPPSRLSGFLKRLNVRFVLALSVVALVGLLVSGVAINQILPGYFAEQSAQRVQSAAISTGLLIQREVAQLVEEGSGVAAVPELRDQVVAPLADDVVRFLIPATVEIFNEAGQLVGRAAPEDPAALMRQGLRRETGIVRREPNILVEVPGPRAVTSYTVVVRDPYTSREATLERIRDALIGSGILALAASLITGAIVARRLTVPIYRLRRVAARVAQGQLDERATPSGVLEIDELAAQFNATADRLAESLRMLEADRDQLREFVADVSHELRTPIAALRTFTELQRDGDVDEATRREFLDRSRQQISRLEWLSTNLLDLSRIDAGIFPLDVQLGDLRDPLRSVVEAHAEEAEERGIVLTSEVPGQPVELRFDYERIVQLVTNLVTNGLKFTPRGGRVVVDLTDTPDRVVIEVRDTGPGIPAEELPRIFERFYRGTNTGEARASGSGLGLAIVRSIVEMHGGHIDVASVVGEGTVFRIELPRNINKTSSGVRAGAMRGS